MANKLILQKLVDSNKRALLKFVFISDGTATANATLVDVSNLAFSLNANGYIMVSNTHPKSQYRTSIRRLFGEVIKPEGHIILQWHGDSNSEIAVFNSNFDINFENMIDGGTIPNPEANSSGDILFTVTHPRANDAFTIFMDLRKHNEDYDAGQSADPKAFNR